MRSSELDCYTICMSSSPSRSCPEMGSGKKILTWFVGGRTGWDKALRPRIQHAVVSLSWRGESRLVVSGRRKRDDATTAPTLRVERTASSCFVSIQLDGSIHTGYRTYRNTVRTRQTAQDPPTDDLIFISSSDPLTRTSSSNQRIRLGASTNEFNQ